MTRRKRIVVGCLLAVIGLPVALVLAVVAFLHALNPFLLGGRDEHNGTLVSSGRKREYLLHVPARRLGGKPAPLVISLHPAAVFPTVQRNASRWNELADREGFFVVYPWGRRIAPLSILPSLPVWPVESEAALTEEVAFIADLIDELVRTHGVDPARVYVNGFSNGGAMTFVLSCRLSHRIAAVGTVASAHVLPWSWCTDTRPMPLIAFHGTEDPLVPYRGGWSFEYSFPSAPDWAANWARRNRCAKEPIATRLRSTTRLAYTGCAEGTEVRLYTIEGGGHTWPGGSPLPRLLVGRTGTGVNATREMWEFFRRYRLSTLPGPAPSS
jgi:polyhydroxybutyrate depolymerase